VVSHRGRGSSYAEKGGRWLKKNDRKKKKNLFSVRGLEVHRRRGDSTILGEIGSWARWFLVDRENRRGLEGLVFERKERSLTGVKKNER